ncbi:adenylate/guanylate cyclase domain-containing protein [Cupriavidus pinatubonensis]|uniref:Guanylate cyclase domain-containing protein n=1 Tax=Cupriavidus pinatubonensis TaxID=248026 RepID=A0ABM8XK67_9BURK|nr:adenylate/guanylate cyclase domain-containing protein [Cupriavidus pinatubonensis]CAG9180606.1 hypothetical protein LMG23994_04457 [Cupriavidus pinatubonensis]
MASRTWDQSAAKERIAARIREVESVEVRDYVRETDLTGLGNGLAYRVDGVHLYVDILNVAEMLNTTAYEGTMVHRRTLRFLNQHYRAVRRILLAVDAIQIDFHNQRLHAVFTKPYDDEAARVHRAIATAQLIIDVLHLTGEDEDDPLPGAQVRVGIDSGVALAVNNGRRGHREPLFLGPPANLAAKRAGGGSATGIYLTNTARATIGLDEVDDEDRSALGGSEIALSQEEADLDVTVEKIVDEWRKGLEKNPIGVFEFSAHTPPFKDLDLELLTPANSRRQDAVSIYADIDGFTNYVGDRVAADETAEDVVRVLHVLRGELDAVIHSDFAGRKIRFIGDCIHGVLIEGTAATTDASQTATNAMLCAGALRSSFELALSMLNDEGIDVGELGLAIGVEYGVIAITRLGVKGEMIRCCISRAVLQSEIEQLRCNGSQTAIGATAKTHCPEAIASIFGDSRRKTNLRYETVIAALEKENSQKAAAQSNSLLRQASTVAAAGFTFPAKAAGPSKTPAGFA